MMAKTTEGYPDTSEELAEDVKRARERLWKVAMLLLSKEEFMASGESDLPLDSYFEISGESGGVEIQVGTKIVRSEDGSELVTIIAIRRKIGDIHDIAAVLEKGSLNQPVVDSMKTSECGEAELFSVGELTETNILISQVVRAFDVDADQLDIYDFDDFDT